MDLLPLLRERTTVTNSIGWMSHTSRWRGCNYILYIKWSIILLIVYLDWVFILKYTWRNKNSISCRAHLNYRHWALCGSWRSNFVAATPDQFSKENLHQNLFTAKYENAWQKAKHFFEKGMSQTTDSEYMSIWSWVTLPFTYQWKHFPSMLTDHCNGGNDIIQLSGIHKVWQIQPYKTRPVNNKD